MAIFYASASTTVSTEIFSAMNLFLCSDLHVRGFHICGKILQFPLAYNAAIEHRASVLSVSAEQR